MNLLEKLHAIFVSDDVNIWHYPCAKSPTSQFCYWLTAEPDNQSGHSCDTLEQLIEEAYGHIDPLRKPLPEKLKEPKGA